MLNAMPIVYFVYAAALFGGGLMGYIKAQSVPSLVGSSVFAVLALVAGIVTRNNPQTGLIIGVVNTLLVIGLFVYRYVETQKGAVAFPAIGMSMIVLGLTVAALSQSPRGATSTPTPANEEAR
ncbi:MAG: TMEM14 family protein [Fibrella sp.]|nr:TMEM14 family protein [Armatimonadota bacterium]